MRPNLINRLKEEWNNLDPVDPLRGLLSDAIDALAEQPAQQEEPVAWITSAGVLYRSEDVDGCFDESHVPLYKQQQSTKFEKPVVRWVCKGCGHEYMEAPSSCDCMESREYERVEYFTSPPASKPLTDEMDRQAAQIEDYSQRNLFITGWLHAEAAHNIKEST